MKLADKLLRMWQEAYGGSSKLLVDKRTETTIKVRPTAQSLFLYDKEIIRIHHNEFIQLWCSPDTLLTKRRINVLLERYGKRIITVKGFLHIKDLSTGKCSAYKEGAYI